MMFYEDYSFGTLGDEPTLSKLDWLILILLIPGGWVFLLR